MVIREARYLSGNDIGKTIIAGKHRGTLEEIGADDHNVEIWVKGTTRPALLDRSTPVTIIGQKRKPKP